mgnify:CR=1 FL=1
MFDTLSDKLQRVFKNLRGEGRLTAENMDAALKEIRVALLEADVHFKVVKAFIEAVRAKAMGQEVLTALSPAQQVIKIVRDELVHILGSHASRIRTANQPPTILMIVGLQGSGKTTTTAKLARHLGKNGHRPLMVSVDVYRPAAREQLAVLARNLSIPVFEGNPGAKPLELARGAKREAEITGRDIVLIDTAGRLHIDEELMVELEELKNALHPTEILFVADAMTGQDAVRSAEEFHKRLGITGVILTKMDGDARGGAALSIRHITGQPLKFVGTGEKPDALEPFHPDRIANRILGMGDVLSFIDKVQEAVDQKKAEEMQRKLLTDEFTQATGCKVNTKDGASSDDMIALLQSGAYDGGSFSGNATVRLMATGDVAPIETEFITNWDDIQEGIKNQDYNSLDGQAYGVPHGRGPNYLMFRTDVVPEDTDSWGVIWEDDQLERYKGKISIYDDSIFIADAALWLKATQPELGIENPYQLTQEQFDAAVALLKSKKNPTDRDIDEAMAGNLCRCGTYQRVRAAIKDAARALG